MDLVRLPELTKITGHILSAWTETLTVSQVDGTPGPATIYANEAGTGTPLSTTGQHAWVNGEPTGWVLAGHSYDIAGDGGFTHRFEAVKASVDTTGLAGRMDNAEAGITDLGSREGLYAAAVGDGTTDDTGAIHAGRDTVFAAGGGIVRLRPNKTYLVTGLTLLSGVYLYLPRSSTIKLKSGSNANTIAATNATRCGVIGGGKIDANQAGQTAGNGILFTNVQFFTLECEVVNAWNNAVLLDTACGDGWLNVQVGNAGSDANEAALIAAGTSGCHGVALSSGCYSIRGFIRVRDSFGAGLNISQSYRCSFIVDIEKVTADIGGGYGGLRWSNGSQDNYVAGSLRGYSRGVFAPVATDTINNVADVSISNTYLQAVLLQAPRNMVRARIRDASQGTTGEATRVDGASYCRVDADTYDSLGTRHLWGFRETGASDFNRFVGSVEGFVTDTVVLVGAHTKIDVATAETPDIAISSAITLRGHTDFINLTGGGVTLTTINATRVGRIYVLKFNGSNTVAHGTGNIRLKSGANLAVVAGSTLTLLFDGTNMIEV